MEHILGWNIGDERWIEMVVRLTDITLSSLKLANGALFLTIAVYLLRDGHILIFSIISRLSVQLSAGTPMFALMNLSMDFYRVSLNITM